MKYSLKSRLLSLLYILATGYILFFYSELLFWARPRPEDVLSEWLLTWLAYSLSGYAFLSAVAVFRVRERWALFLCGALFGWLTEGVIVQTMYDSFPLQISWTGLSWHALISVWFGWYAVQRSLLHGSIRKTLAVSAGLGLFWGVWAIWWWVEAPAQIAGLGEFAAFAWLSSLLLALAYWLNLRLAPLQPARLGIGVTAGVFILLFALNAVPAAPLAIFILPPLLLVLFIALNRSRHQEAPGSLLDNLHGSPPPANFLALSAAPLTATLIYALALWLDVRLPSGWLVYALSMPLGFILLGIGLYRLLWRRQDIQSSPRPD